jgi:hypothetical protein
MPGGVAGAQLMMAAPYADSAYGPLPPLLRWMRPRGSAGTPRDHSVIAERHCSRGTHPAPKFGIYCSELRGDH